MTDTFAETDPAVEPRLLGDPPPLPDEVRLRVLAAALDPSAAADPALVPADTVIDPVIAPADLDPADVGTPDLDVPDTGWPVPGDEPHVPGHEHHETWDDDHEDW